MLLTAAHREALCGTRLHLRGTQGRLTADGRIPRLHPRLKQTVCTALAQTLYCRQQGECQAAGHEGPLGLPDHPAV